MRVVRDREVLPDVVGPDRAEARVGGRLNEVDLGALLDHDGLGTVLRAQLGLAARRDVDPSAGDAERQAAASQAARVDVEPDLRGLAVVLEGQQEAAVAGSDHVLSRGSAALRAPDLDGGATDIGVHHDLGDGLGRLDVELEEVDLRRQRGDGRRADGAGLALRRRRRARVVRAEADVQRLDELPGARVENPRVGRIAATGHEVGRNQGGCAAQKETRNGHVGNPLVECGISR